MFARIGEPLFHGMRSEKSGGGTATAVLEREGWMNDLETDSAPLVRENEEGRPEQPHWNAGSQRPKRKREGGPIWTLLFGVLLPAFTLGLELITGFCANTFFNPIPTIGHVLLVALVPIINAAAWWRLGKARDWTERERNWFGFANGMAVLIAIVYSLLYLPLVIPGVVAIIFVGMGFLPLSPMFSLFATLRLRRGLRQQSNESERGLPCLWRGMAVGLLLLAAIDFPHYSTLIALQKANGASAKESVGAISWLRNFGHEQTMLRACYGNNTFRNPGAIVTWAFPGQRELSLEDARRIYFRVTGKPFNSVPAPGNSRASGS
jgi:hypothetical protein